MISEWKPKTEYFIELSKDRLQEVLEDNLVQIIGYNPDNAPYTFEQACFQLKYLKNGNVACGVQLRNANEFDNACVIGYITSEYLDLAKYMHQVEEFLTIDEYKKLIPLEDEV